MILGSFDHSLTTALSPNNRRPQQCGQAVCKLQYHTDINDSPSGWCQNKLPLSTPIPHSAVCYRSLLAVCGGVAGLGFSDFVAVMMCGHSRKMIGWSVGTFERNGDFSKQGPWHGRGSKCATVTTDLVKYSTYLYNIVGAPFTTSLVCSNCMTVLVCDAIDSVMDTCQTPS